METPLESALRTIIDRLLILPKCDNQELNRVKADVSSEFKLTSTPSNADLIKVLSPEESRKLIPLLTRKKTRVASGVTVVAVMTEPRPCPHGRCAYCPGGPEEGVPQSYTGHEPASMRGAQNQYDPFLQVSNRVSQLRSIGHVVDKVDLIIMGGTFPAAPWDYQRWFVKGCLDALNECRSSSLEKSKELAYSSRIRNVGITVETRPEIMSAKEIDHLLSLGVTRVELGVQNVYDDVYELVGRGHTVKDVVEATKNLKDSGLKVCYHMMPGLPGSTTERDMEGLRLIFSDPRFKPDMLKIYPTLVLKGTKLHEMWLRGDYVPPTTEEMVELVARVKMIVPPWVRIMRVQRDIPAWLIEAGVDKSNLRQLAQQHLRDLGGKCRCIRCREVGRQQFEEAEPDPERLKVLRSDYEASEGIENFITVEDPETDVLVGFLRLRLPSEGAHRPEFKPRTAVVRELHVYGRMVPVGLKEYGAWQHKGWGEVLISEAERVAKEEYDAYKISVMSALGTKQYYSRLGYEKDGMYMSKLFSGSGALS